MKIGRNLEDSLIMRSKAMKNSTNILTNKHKGLTIRRKVHQEEMKPSLFKTKQSKEMRPSEEQKKKDRVFDKQTKKPSLAKIKAKTIQFHLRKEEV